MIFSKNDQWSLIKLKILSRWLMILNQIWHGLLPYLSTFYLLPTHPPTYYLHVNLFTYTFSPTYLHTYLCFSPSYESPIIYMSTYLPILFHLPTYILFTYLSTHLHI